MNNDEQIVRRLYEGFNARDMDGVLSLLAGDVVWANGMEGTHVHGTAAVREYWSHQWSVIDPHVEPTQVRKATDGSMVVEVHQTVRDLEGQLLLDETVGHVFRLADGLVTRFDIQPGSQLAAIHKTTARD